MGMAKPAGKRTILVTCFCIILFLTVGPQIVLGGEDHVDETSGTVYAWPLQKEEDQFEILYLEFVMASWNLSGSVPWNAYHSAIAVRNYNDHPNSGLELVADYSPHETDEIKHVVHPHIRSPNSPFLDAALHLFGIRLHNKSQHKVEWNNIANVNIEFGIDYERYKNVTYLGDATGKAVNALSRWISEYNNTRRSFEPIEIAVAGEGTVLPSQICHDFVTDSLWVLHDTGEAEFAPETHIFRDHIILFAEPNSIQKITKPDPNDLSLWGPIVRYYEEIEKHMGIINIEFTFARIFYAEMFKRNVSTYMYDGNLETAYHSFKLAEPFLNYCYMPLFMPPERSNIFESPKHCALPFGVEDHDALQLTLPLRYHMLVFDLSTKGFAFVFVFSLSVLVFLALPLAYCVVKCRGSKRSASKDKKE